MKPPTVVNNNKDKKDSQEIIEDKTDDSKSKIRKIENTPIKDRPVAKINEDKPQDSSEEIDLEESDIRTGKVKQSGK